MEGTVLDVKDMLVGGRHNFENAAAAAALARIAGIDDAAIGRGLAGFRGLQHRLEFSGEAGGRAILQRFEIHHCRIGAVRRDRIFATRVHLIAGGRDKGCDFSLVKPALGSRVARRLSYR